MAGDPIRFRAGAKDGSHIFKEQMYTVIAGFVLLDNFTSYILSDDGELAVARELSTLEAFSALFPKSGLLNYPPRTEAGELQPAGGAKMLCILFHPELRELGHSGGCVYLWLDLSPDGKAPFRSELTTDELRYAVTHEYANRYAFSAFAPFVSPKAINRYNDENMLYQLNLSKFLSSGPPGKTEKSTVCLSLKQREKGGDNATSLNKLKVPAKADGSGAGA